MKVVWQKAYRQIKLLQ